MKRTVAVVATAIAVGLGCPGPRGPVRPGRPKLVVLIVVDQLPTWTFERRKPLFTHGFTRLLREGVYWPSTEYPYANTYTAPGHAAIATGAPPRVSGVDR